MTADGPLVERRSGAVVHVTVDHPPHQLVDGSFLASLIGLLDRLDGDPMVRAVVFRSADPEFFLMHADVHQLLALPDRTYEPVTAPNIAAATFARLTGAPYLSVGVIEGAARGGGAEFLAALDLRIATPAARLGQPEAPMGILPGAGGTARLAHLLGRAAALDVIVTGRDVTASEAHRLGWVDHVVDGDLDEFLAALLRRVAGVPAASIAAVKRVVDISLSDGLAAGLVAESDERARRMADGEYRARMQAFVDAGGQTREGERGDTASLLDAMGAVDDRSRS